MDPTWLGRDDFPSALAGKGALGDGSLDPASGAVATLLPLVLAVWDVGQGLAVATRAGNGVPGDRADTQDPNGEHVRHHQEEEESNGTPYTHKLLRSSPFTVTPESRPPGRRYVILWSPRGCTVA